MIRFSILFCLLLISATGFAEQPNILFIVSDDQGWNDIGYHNPDIKSPNLDELARTGVELDCHYVQPQCTPTRVALMTGRYPSRFGNHCCQASNAQAFPIGTLTLASMLKSVGYETGMSGKWHLGSDPKWGPNHYGFDHSHGSLTGAVGMYDHRYRLNSPYAITWHRNLEMIEEEGHVTDLSSEEAIGWIRDRADSDQPWFFYLPLHAVHTPLVEKDEKWIDMNSHFADDDRRLFAAAVSHMDDAIGNIVRALDETKQRDDTLIIFTSDNGAQVNHGGGAYPAPDPALKNFSSNHPLRGQKTGVYEGGFRVPAFANWKGTWKSRKVSQPMHVVDWVPTIANLVGAELPNETQFDGIDMTEALADGSQDGDSRIFYIVWGSAQNRVALRHGDWKLVRIRDRNELYNLSDDPYEKDDLANAQPEQLAHMLDLLRQQQKLDAPKD